MIILHFIEKVESSLPLERFFETRHEGVVGNDRWTLAALLKNVIRLLGICLRGERVDENKTTTFDLSRNSLRARGTLA